MRVAIVFALVLISVSALADTEAMFTLPSGVKVNIVEAPFEKKLFKVSGCTESSQHCFINGHVPAGILFGLPKTYVKSITVSYQSRSYSLDAADMYDAWGVRPVEYKGAVRYFGGRCRSAKNCEFRGLFSDGAATFVAEWRVVDGLPVRTVLSDNYDIVHLFMRHIDPPILD
jgi:hypothetical protein